jgi:hypothetical protein
VSLCKTELLSCNLLECLQQAYSGTLLQSYSSHHGDDGDDREPDASQSTTSTHSSKSSAESALDRLFADRSDGDVLLASLVQHESLLCSLVLVTRKVNVFIATSTVFVAHSVKRGTVGAQLRAIPNHCDGDYIVDVRLVQLAELDGDDDGVVIVAAYSRGHVRVFDPAGRLLLAKRFDDQPTVGLRFRTDNLQSGPLSAQSEDVAVLYAGGVVVHIAGLAFYSAVRARLKRLAAAQPVGDDAAELAFRKWRLTGCGEIVDVAVLGVQCREVLQLHNASSPPGAQQLTTDMIAVGSNPAFALFDAAADDSALVSAISAAQDVAAKLASSVLGYARSWWSSAPTPAAAEAGGGAAEKKERFEAAASVAMRCGVFDEPRRIYRVALSATGHLAATCDSLGRVALLDAQNLLMVKLWKGYRDAQLAWLLSSGGERRQQYLLIHAPRRSQVELWRTRHAAKAAASENVGRALLVRRTGVLLGAVKQRGAAHEHAVMVRANGTVFLVGIRSSKVKE